jgi:3'-phosphoadenosine 5'-phosphosulfate sulfotransferase
VTLREEHRVRVFEIRVLTRIFGPKRGEVVGVLRKIHNEEIMYSSPNIIRPIKSKRTT